MKKSELNLTKQFANAQGKDLPPFHDLGHEMVQKKAGKIKAKSLLFWLTNHAVQFQLLLFIYLTLNPQS